MKSDTQLKVQSYLDSELSPGEARKMAGLISSDREAQELYDHLRFTKELLRANEPVVKLDESRDFYWSKIQREIARTEQEPARGVQRPLWIRLLAPIAGTAALFALLLSIIDPKQTEVTANNGEMVSAESQPILGEAEDLASDFSSVTFRSEESGVTVVWLTARE